MLKRLRPETRRVIRRWGIVTAILAPLVLAGICGVFWLETHVTRAWFWRAGLVIAIGFETLYVAAAGAGAIGLTVALIAARSKRPRTPRRRLMLLRTLAVSGSILLAVALAEAATAVWKSALRSPQSAAQVAWRNDRAEEIAAIKSAHKITLRTQFPDPPGDPAIDILTLGESSAEGVPYAYWVSLTRLLEWRLGEVFPGRKIQSRVLAVSGETLAGEHAMLEFLERRPDLFLIYCGHNEITARISGSRDLPYYHDALDPGVWDRLVAGVESVSQVCGFAREQVDRCRIAIPRPRYGDRYVIDTPSYTEAEHARLLADFRDRLDTIVAYGTRLGAVVVLIAPAANDADYEPNRSYLSPDTPRAERDRFRGAFLAARALESGPPGPALDTFSKLAAQHPEFAEAHYRMAIQLGRLGRFEEAYQEYIRARDRDGYPMRLQSVFQQVYADVARKHGALLIDMQTYFHAIGAHGLLDDHLFHDAMHPSLRGQIALAQAVLVCLRARGAFGWPASLAVAPIDPRDCVDHFGLIPAAWRYLCTWGIMFYDLTYPMRYDRTLRLAKRKAFADAVTSIDAGVLPEAVGLPNIGTPEPVPIVRPEALVAPAK